MQDDWLFAEDYLQHLSLYPISICSCSRLPLDAKADILLRLEKGPDYSKIYDAFRRLTPCLWGPTGDFQPSAVRSHQQRQLPPCHGRVPVRLLRSDRCRGICCRDQWDMPRHLCQSVWDQSAMPCLIPSYRCDLHQALSQVNFSRNSRAKE